MAKNSKSYLLTAVLVAAGIILALGGYVYQHIVYVAINWEIIWATLAIGIVMIAVGVYAYLQQGWIVLWVWKRLNFVMQHQQQGNWCWAAVAASVSAYFNPNTTWTQCKIANAELGQTDCCTNGSSASCNVPWYLDRALTLTGNFVSMSSGAGTMNDVTQEINNNRPLCVRIGWSGGGGHFVAIDGYNIGLDMVAVDDPWSGASDVDLSVFQTAYNGSGSWTHSYKVKP